MLADRFCLNRKSLIAALAPVSILLAGACTGGGDAPRNDAGSLTNATIVPDDRPGERNGADPAANQVTSQDPADPGLAGLTPYQRRAYDRGFSDCRAGRYEPDRYPESYRIGCAAAHDREGGEPPQG